jgi:hypothetical protein
MVLPIHDTPGRLRFRIRPIKGDRRSAAALRARMEAIEGVAAASANPLTGSLLVHHDGAPATRERILGSLGGFEPEPVAPAFALGPRAAAVTDALTTAVVERVIEHALRAAVAAVI